MKKYLLSLIAMLAMLVSSCSKDATLDESLTNPAENAGGEIRFGMPETRTIYGSQQSDKSWPVYWTSGDQIKIFCAQSPQGSAIYKTDGNGTKSTANISKTSNPLTWSQTSGIDHFFYAVYPATSEIEVDANGVAKFPVNRRQQAVVTTTNGIDADVQAKVDMNNQYMVASTRANPSASPDGTVWLDFRPIMTTLDIVVKAANVGMNVPGSARITGISIASTVTTNQQERTTFYYDIVDDKIVAGGVANTGVAAPHTEQIYIDLMNANGEGTYVDLANGHTLTVTAFLPPMDVATAAKLKRQVTVRVHATGATELIASIKTNDASSSSWTTQLTPGSKRKVQLPAFPTAEVSNNWITPLDGDIYVSQLSIPGAHDSATGNGFAGLVNGIIGSEGAVTQERTLSEQWDLGVRAFDLRPALYEKNFPLSWLLGYEYQMYIYHSSFRTSLTWDSAISTLENKLSKNKGEFAIIIFRHENERTIDNEDLASKEIDPAKWDSEMKKLIDKKQSLFVKWRPDLTIEEARGKIILISRESGSWTHGCFTGWNHNAEGGVHELRSADGSASGTLYVQDYYSASSSSEKWNAIKRYLDISKTFHTDESRKNHWMINHVSGYILLGTTTGYQYNAGQQNTNLNSLLVSSSWQGSTGICVFDFAGVRQSEIIPGLGDVIPELDGFDTTVNGDITLQRVINNNYRYRMRRKGE